MIVSILVLLDFVLKVFFPEHLVLWLPVSILVLLDFVLKAVHSRSVLVPASIVSILVLLDFVLKVSSSVILLNTRLRFNPCFIGFCS